LDDDFDIDQLLKLRKLTRSIADHLTRELRSHLSTLTPLLNPKSVFGEHIRGASRIAGKSAAQAMDELQSLYQDVHHTKPFSLRSHFDTPITLLAASLEIQPAFYSYTANTESGSKIISISSPLKWILSFEGFGPSRLSELLTTPVDAAGPKLQECVLHSLLLNLTLQKRPGVRKLLQALRFNITTEQLPKFGELPLVMISAPLSTLRPPDRIIVESTEMSGTIQFEEVVDSKAIANIEDPVKKKLAELVAESG
jgi:hypothetical protein